MHFLARLAFVLALLLAAAAPAVAEAPPKLPQGMSQADFDKLVTAISREVLQKLREQGVKAGDTPAAETKPAPTTRAVFQRMGATLSAFPVFLRQIGTLGAQVDDPSGHSAFVFILLLAAAIFAALAIEWLVRTALGRLRLAVVANGKPPLGPLRLIALLILDAVAVGALWLAAEGAEGILGGNEAQTRLATVALTGLVFWRFNMFIFRAWLQPDFAIARITPIDDAGAQRVYRGLNAMLIIMVVVRVWMRLHMGAGTPPDAIGAAMLVNNIFVLASFCFIVWWMRAPVATWLGALAGPSVGVQAWKGVVTHYWWIGGIAFYLILSAAQAVGVLAGRLEVGTGLLKTQSIVVAWLLIESLMWYFAHRREVAAAAEHGPHEPRLVEVTIRCLRVAVRVAVVVELSSIWVVEVLGLVTKDEWWKVGSTFATAGIIVFLAYVLWQIVKFQIDRYIARNPIAVSGPGAHDGEPGAPPPQAASRLRTLLPLLRVTIGIAIFILTVLIVLSELGVNTAPLIAGASIFGLALSFGSQALVRDVVSGVFYLVDDAFRVGEYVDTGKAKGTVEGFTLRSIQLRHQNGQVHTIPFGQLGTITNFSRDWITVKFNLRFAMGTDIEVVRKTAKKIGQEMLEDPELKPLIIEPLKLQGLADIADNSLVLRFKFTARPGNPTLVQRQSIRRLFKAFSEKGIEFARATVSVQSVGEAAGASAAGAAAQATRAASADG